MCTKHLININVACLFMIWKGLDERIQQARNIWHFADIWRSLSRNSYCFLNLFQTGLPSNYPCQGLQLLPQCWVSGLCWVLVLLQLSAASDSGEHALLLQGNAPFSCLPGLCSPCSSFPTDSSPQPPVPWTLSLALLFSLGTLAHILDDLIQPQGLQTISVWNTPNSIYPAQTSPLNSTFINQAAFSTLLL